MFFSESVEQIKGLQHLAAAKPSGTPWAEKGTSKVQLCSGGLLPFAADLRLSNTMTYLLPGFHVTALA